MYDVYVIMVISVNLNSYTNGGRRCLLEWRLSCLSHAGLTGF